MQKWKWVGIKGNGFEGQPSKLRQEHEVTLTYLGRKQAAGTTGMRKVGAFSTVIVVDSGR